MKATTMVADFRLPPQVVRRNAEPDHEPDFGDVFRAVRGDGGTVSERSGTSAGTNGHSRDAVDDDVQRPIGIAELRRQHPTLHEPVIDGLLREGETANIVAAPKVGKSWMSYSLALSVCTGRSWLETFPCNVGRVLLIDNELHQSTIANRIPKVADALGIVSTQYEDSLDVLSLRGQCVDLMTLGRRLQGLEDRAYLLVIADAWYRFIPQGLSENSNADVTRLFNLIDQYAGMLGCGWVNIHHTSKGSQGDKAVTDIGSGAGAQSRAADNHIALLEHDESGCVVLHSRPRSFPRVDPLPLRWTFPIWRPAGDIDPAKVVGRLSKGERRQSESDKEGMRAVLDVLRTWNTETDGLATPNRIIAKSPYGDTKTRNLLSKVLHSGDVTREPITIRGNNTHVYTIAE